MSEQVNKEQTKDANQEKSTELSDGQLDEVEGAAGTRATSVESKTTKEDGTDGGDSVAPGGTVTLDYTLTYGQL